MALLLLGLKKTEKKSTWNNNLYKQDSFFLNHYLFYGPHAAVLIILKKIICPEVFCKVKNTKM